MHSSQNLIEVGASKSVLVFLLGISYFLKSLLVIKVKKELYCIKFKVYVVASNIIFSSINFDVNLHLREQQNKICLQNEASWSVFMH